MDKGLLGWIYLLNPCGCPPLSDDDPKECQQLISQSAGRTPVPAIIRVLSKQRFKPCVPQMFKEICSHLHRPGSAWDTSAWGMLAAGVQVWLPHACATWMFPIPAVELNPCYGSSKQMLRTHVYWLVLSSAFQFFNMMCLPAKIADTPLVWKDQTCLERSYSGRDSDTVNSTMEWGLKVYLLSNEEKDKQILRERSALHKPFKSLSFCHMPKQHHNACQKSKSLPTKDMVCQAREWSLAFRPQTAQAGKGRDAALQCPGCRTGRSPCLHHIYIPREMQRLSSWSTGQCLSCASVPPSQPKATPIPQHDAAGIR